MSLKIDLHCHSTHSDGVLTPTELVERAHLKGVEVLALTDHDSTAGLTEAQQTADRLGLRLVNGVEISVTWSRQTIHIVGVGIDPAYAPLQEGLELIREQRAVRARRMAEKLEKSGLKDVMKGIVEYAGTEAATRTHFARYLVDYGHVSNMQGAFKQFLGRKGKAFVGGEWVSLEKAVGWIVGAGGQAIIAHPIRYKMTNTKLGELIDAFKAAGGDGIEVSTSSHMPHERRKVVDIAQQYALKSSVGSDFHEPGSTRVELGHNLALPEGAQAIWDDWDLDDDAATRVASGGLV